MVNATALSNTTLFAQSAAGRGRPQCDGDKKVYYRHYDDPSLDHLGCDWRPSRHDGKIISGLLNTFTARCRRPGSTRPAIRERPGNAQGTPRS